MSTRQEEIEYELEDLLLRVVPGLAEQWQGAAPGAIDQIEQLAGRPLPSFYRWFLAHMGQSMGPLAFPTQDFSAQRVLACYAKKLVVPEPRFLLIGYESNEMMPLHTFYDLDAPVRCDAMVTGRYARETELHDKFETLHEMLAWSAFVRFQVGEMQQQCKGTFHCEHRDLLSLVVPVMSSLGFTQPITTGPYCGIYERPDAVMICNGSPRDDLDNVRTFILGGGNAGSLRKILGAIAAESSLEVEVNEWTPPLR